MANEASKVNSNFFIGLFVFSEFLSNDWQAAKWQISFDDNTQEA
jgi:hypothetical protein